MVDPVSCLSHSLGHALYSPDGFSPIMEKRKDWQQSKTSSVDVFVINPRKHYESEIEVEAMFIQTWGSTALGFGGIGGAAITSDYTIVLRSTYLNEYLVYFGGRFAYKLTKPNQKFFDDLGDKNLTEVYKHNLYT